MNHLVCLSGHAGGNETDASSVQPEAAGLATWCRGAEWWPDGLELQGTDQ